MAIAVEVAKIVTNSCNKIIRRKNTPKYTPRMEILYTSNIAKATCPQLQ